MINLGPYYYGSTADLPAVLLMHSLSDSHEIMEPLAHALNEAGYPVLCPNFSSHAEGNLEEVMAADFSSYQRDGDHFVDYLRNKGYDQLIVAGMSLGGMVSFDLASRYDEVVAVVSIASPMFTDLTLTKVPYFIRQRYFSSFEGGPSKEVRDQSKDLFEDFEKNLRSFNLWMESVFPALRELTLPVFVAQSRKDEIMSSQVAERLGRILNQAHPLQVKFYDQGSHYLTKGLVGKELNQDVLSFLADIN